jgi:hypothetical protein
VGAGRVSGRAILPDHRGPPPLIPLRRLAPRHPRTRPRRPPATRRLLPGLCPRRPAGPVLRHRGLRRLPTVVALTGQAPATLLFACLRNRASRCTHADAAPAPAHILMEIIVATKTASVIDGDGLRSSGRSGRGTIVLDNETETRARARPSSCRSRSRAAPRWTSSRSSGRSGSL